MLIKIDQTCIAKHVWGIVFLSKLKCRCSQFLPAHGARRSMFSSKPFKRLALLFGKQAPCSLHLLLQLVHVIIRLIVTNLTFRADCDWLCFFLAILKVLSERNSPSHLTRMLCSQYPPATKITKLKTILATYSQILCGKPMNKPCSSFTWHRLQPSFMRHVSATEKSAEVQIGAATALGNRQDLVPNMGIPQTVHEK